MIQKAIRLSPKERGFHLVTEEIMEQLAEICEVDTGFLHLFIRHTSASLTINENADPDVRVDMERFFLESVPDDLPYLKHTLEGPDDMPAHIKASLLGASLLIPLQHGKLALGVWQGIWLGEHRVNASSREILATISL